MVVSVTPDELAVLLATQRLDLVDVRDPEEWISGHIDGARMMPLEELRADPDAVLAHGIPIVFVCAKGVRSMQAAKLAERFGYGPIYSVEGGTKEWVRVGRPLVTESTRDTRVSNAA